MNVGLIGRGPWGRVYERALRSIGSPAAWVCGKSDLRFDADAVIIATPSETHAELAQEALRRGLHVLVEKPFALSLRDAEALLLQAHRSVLVAAVSQPHVHSVEWARFREESRGERFALAFFGGLSPTPLWWDKGWHVLGLALDLFRDDEVEHVRFENSSILLGFYSGRAFLARVDSQQQPLRFFAGASSYEYLPPVKESPSPVESMCVDFLCRCYLGGRDISGFRRAARIADILHRAGL